MVIVGKHNHDAKYNVIHLVTALLFYPNIVQQMIPICIINIVELIMSMYCVQHSNQSYYRKPPGT
jgi:hypothetical protein